MLLQQIYQTLDKYVQSSSKCSEDSIIDTYVCDMVFNGSVSHKETDNGTEKQQPPSEK